MMPTFRHTDFSSGRAFGRYSDTDGRRRSEPSFAEAGAVPFLFLLRYTVCCSFSLSSRFLVPFSLCSMFLVPFGLGALDETLFLTSRRAARCAAGGNKVFCIFSAFRRHFPRLPSEAPNFRAAFSLTPTTAKSPRGWASCSGISFFSRLFGLHHLRLVRFVVRLAPKREGIVKENELANEVYKLRRDLVIGKIGKKVRRDATAVAPDP